jgi:hypothetical protein
MYNERQHCRFLISDDIELHRLNMVAISMDQASKNTDKIRQEFDRILSRTISQFCPPKLSKQSHLYVPRRLTHARAALHG